MAHHPGCTSDPGHSAVCDILSDLSLTPGVHLDFGGNATLAKRMQDSNPHLTYVGICEDGERASQLTAQGIEAHVHPFAGVEDGLIFLAFVEQILKGRALSSVSVFDMLSGLSDSMKLLTLLHGLMSAHHAPLLVSVPNIAHKDIAFKMLEGDFDCPANNSIFSHKRLEKVMRDAGFELLSFRDIHDADVTNEITGQHVSDESILLSAATTTHRYLDWLKSAIDPHADVRRFVRTYVPRSGASLKLKKDLKPDEEERRPFLSVISRTRGRRPEALTEMLLCLTGQTDTDFEVLVMGHRLTAEQQTVVERIIEDLPDWMRRQTRLIRVDDGNRTRPLHEGFMAAKGSYVAILDDDDLVLDRWVETFHDLSKTYWGTILHAYAVSQQWDVASSVGGKEALRAFGSPDRMYCVDFDLIKQLTINSCPTMSYAIPRYLYHELGFRYNQELSTNEDWDFLMRAAFVCGVVDAPVVTSIYRRWENYENSQTLHSPAEWYANYLFIRNQMNETPMILPPGYLDSVCGTFMEGQQDPQEPPSPISTPIGTPSRISAIAKKAPILYLEQNGRFSEDTLLKGERAASDSRCWIFKDFPPSKLSALRLVPCDDGKVALLSFHLTVTFEDGKTKEFNAKRIKSNGLAVGSGLVFLRRNPQIHIRFPKKRSLQSLVVSYYLDDGVINELRSLFLRFFGPGSFLYRVLRRRYLFLRRR